MLSRKVINIIFFFRFGQLKEQNWYVKSTINNNFRYKFDILFFFNIDTMWDKIYIEKSIYNVKIIKASKQMDVS